MATKQPRKTVEPVGRPLQYSDIDPVGKKAHAPTMTAWGRQKESITATRGEVFKAQAAAEGRAQTASTPKEAAVAGRSIKKYEREGARLDLVAPTMKNAAVTIPKAAERRVALARGSTERVKRDKSTSPLRDSGAGWYFEHRAALNEVATRHDIPQEKIVAASAVMSPLNSPSNERTAIASLAHLHRENPTLTFDNKSRKALGIKGKTAQFGDLSAEQAARIGSPEHRKGISGIDPKVLAGVASGGPFTNVTKAVRVLRGEVQPHEAIDPHTSSKVWSYHEAIKNAKPGTAVHEEYLTRAQTALHEMPGQQTMDLFGHRHSTEGILNPKGHTAEDTWMNAVSSGQQMEGLSAGRHVVSPAKVVGSEKSIVTVPKTGIVAGEKVPIHPSPHVTGEGIRHAWNNDATIKAAETLSKATDVQVPSVLAQETSWTEARRVAGKDEEYAPRKKTLPAANRGQGRLFT